MNTKDKCYYQFFIGIRLNSLLWIIWSAGWLISQQYCYIVIFLPKH